MDSCLSSWNIENSNFLTVAIDFNLESYVRQHLHRASIHGKRGRQILDYLLRPRFAGVFGKFGIGNQSPWPEMVRETLAKGSNPNEEYGGSSVWALFLCFIASIVQEAHPSETQRQHYFAALVLMVEHGASGVLRRSWLSHPGRFDMYSDPWPAAESTPDELFASRWGPTETAIDQDENGDYLYDVKSLVERFKPSDLLGPHGVEQLQLLFDDMQQSTSSLPSIDKNTRPRKVMMFTPNAVRPNNCKRWSL